MTMQKRRNIILLWLCVILVTFLVPTQIFADSISILEAIDDSEESTETDEDEAESTVYSLLRGSDLNYGTTQITKVSSTEVNVYGMTQCHHVCDKVYVSIYLERKLNGVYSTYKYWEYSTSDATRLAKSLNVKVPTGYYYRVRGYHAAKNDGDKEAISTLTNGIWVS